MSGYIYTMVTVLASVYYEVLLFIVAIHQRYCIKDIVLYKTVLSTSLLNYLPIKFYARIYMYPLSELDHWTGILY